MNLGMKLLDGVKLLAVFSAVVLAVWQFPAYPPDGTDVTTPQTAVITPTAAAD